ncbi:MAG: tetratricopeptide repeat protein [Candidatus Protochlamydia sp.]|nr:tetratricopeptide repeat protein [Candidatus Protochlamydia sp.]
MHLSINSFSNQSISFIKEKVLNSTPKGIAAIALVAFAVIGSLYALYRYCSKARQANDQLAQCELLCRQGRLETATESYVALLTLDPSNLKGLNGYAKILFKQGNFEASAEKYQSVLNVQFSNIQALIGMARILDKKREDSSDQWESAAHECEEILNYDPENINVLLDYAKVLRHTVNDLDGAEPYRTVLAIQPTHCEALLGLAKEVRRNDQVDEAAELCQKACESEPQNAKAKRRYAENLWSQNKFNEAADLYRQSLAIDPLHAETLKNYALLSKDMSAWDDSAQAFETLLTLKPKDSYCAYRYSEVLHEQAKILQAQLQIHPELHEALSNKCLQAAEWTKKGSARNTFDQTFAVLEELVVMNPKKQAILLLMKDILNEHLRDLEYQGKVFSLSEMEHYNRFFRKESEISTTLINLSNNG